MNLKEYNYCKRHHPYALARYLNIKINRITSYCPDECNIHDGGTYKYESDAVYHYLNIPRYITLIYLI